MSNILIIKHGSLGDLIQANGAIEDIKNTHKSSKVLLLTDQNSSVPVKTISDGILSLVKGSKDGGHLISSFVKEDKTPKIGDLLVTSGTAQIFPPDLLVGKIVKIIENRFYVLPFVDFNNLDYVQIVKSE